jgi:hypothetical protein
MHFSALGCGNRRKLQKTVVRGDVAPATDTLDSLGQGGEMKYRLLALVVVAVVGGAGPVLASPNTPDASQVAPDPTRPWLIPPVDGPIVQRWQAPGTDWGAGHRGIDYYTAPQTAVRAAGPGHVAFAGSVAGVNAVTIEHSGDLTTTYTDLDEVLVAEGSYVLQGEWVGRSGVTHRSSGQAGLHFGVKVAGTYVDPEDFLGPIDVSGAIHLTPLIGEWARDIPEYGAGSHLDESCRDPVPASTGDSPNDNIAVVVPGLAGDSNNGFRHNVFDLADSLGYPPARTYLFSYKGSDATDLHEPYKPTDTYDGLRAAAGKLTTMLIRIADLHPGSDVDVLAYSQGGLVARSALEHRLSSWGPGLPRIDHLVTYSTPHSGSKLAELPDELRTGSLSGSLLTETVSRWSRGGAAIADPNSLTVGDLRPDSTFINELADHDVVYGTRVLSMSIPNDWVVPVARTVYPEHNNDVVPAGLSGHGAILSSKTARDVAQAFLRDAPPSCSTSVDHLAPGASRVLDFAHDHAADAYAAVEDALIGKALRRLRRPPRP